MKSKLIELLLRGISFLPRGAQRSLGNRIGRRLYKKGGRDFRITQTNLSACFPDMSAEELDKLALKSLQATATWGLETSSVWFRGESWRNKSVLSVENKELFDAALASDAGLMLLIPHFGNWELAGMWASTFAPTTAIYRTPRMTALDGMLRRVRDIGTTNMVPASSRGVMAVVKALGRGEMTVVLPDQEPALEGGIFSSFFGVPALTMTLIHRLIVKTKPEVLIAYARRVDGGHIVGFQEPDPGIFEEDQQLSVDAMSRSIEQLVLAAPAQYQWEYKRFRKQPEGNSKLY
jgi:KDO2-lipid IV(A) lauroyltransferase